MPHFTTHIQHSTIISREIRQGKRIKGIQIEMKEWYDLIYKNPKDYTKKLSKLINSVKLQVTNQNTKIHSISIH